MDSKYENYKVKDRMSSDKVYSIHPQLLSVQFVQASSNNWKAKPINTIPAAVHLHSVGSMQKISLKSAMLCGRAIYLLFSMML